jgi:hypothetical protein
MNLDVHFIINCLLFYYTITSNGKEICIHLECYIERDATTYAKYVVFQSPTYMKALLSKHPFYT